jgi:hypothetical protein
MRSRVILATILSLLAMLLLSVSSLMHPARAEGKANVKPKEMEIPKELVPSLFTMQDKDIPLGTALEELAKQTGNQIEDLREAKEDTKIKLDLKKVTFWQALDAIAKAADAKIALYDRSGKLGLVDGPYLSLPVSYSGLFRIHIKRIDVIQSLDMDAHICSIRMDIAWEPKFHALFMDPKPDPLVVQDDKGRALDAPDENKGLGAIGGRHAAEIEVRVNAPHRNAAQLALFKGRLAVLGPSKTLTFNFDKLSKIEKKAEARKETQDGVIVNIRELRPEGEGDDQIWTIGLLLEYPPDGPKFESFQSWIVNNEIYLEKEKDGIKQRFPCNFGLETDEQSENKALMRYRFGDQPEKKLLLGKISDWKLVYRTPGRIAAIPIPFEFKDLPLP